MSGWQWLGVTMLVAFFVALFITTVAVMGWVEGFAVWGIALGGTCLFVLATLLISGMLP